MRCRSHPGRGGPRRTLLLQSWRKRMVQFGTHDCLFGDCHELLPTSVFFLPLPLEPYPTLFPPLLDLSPPRALLRHWPKSCSSAMSAHGCFLVDQQRICPSVFLAHGGDPELLLSLGKPDGLVWHFRLFGFPVLKSSCPASGRCISNGRLMRSSLHG
jgi:hypothetical protein